MKGSEEKEDRGRGGDKTSFLFVHSSFEPASFSHLGSLVILWSLVCSLLESLSLASLALKELPQKYGERFAHRGTIDTNRSSNHAREHRV